MNNKRWLLSVSLILLTTLVISGINSSCNSATDKNKEDDENASGKQTSGNLIRGEKLALNYCQRCHAFPDPLLLDKKTWVDRVLPNMGWRLGIREKGVDPFADLIPEEEKIIRATGVYPETQLLSKPEWDEIVEYYKQSAPEEPLPQKKVWLLQPLSQDSKPG